MVCDGSRKDILSIGNRVIRTTLYDKYPEVRKSLFTILPVSPLIGLSSSTIDDIDYYSLKNLSDIAESTLIEMLSSPDFFVDAEYVVGIESDERQRLYNKFGLYGIYILTESLRRNKDASVDFCPIYLKRKVVSGNSFSQYNLILERDQYLSNLKVSYNDCSMKSRKQNSNTSVRNMMPWPKQKI